MPQCVESCPLGAYDRTVGAETQCHSCRHVQIMPHSRSQIRIFVGIDPAQTVAIVLRFVDNRQRCSVNILKVLVSALHVGIQKAAMASSRSNFFMID